MGPAVIRTEATPLTPARIAIIYIVFGALWILFSDAALHAVVGDPELERRLQTAKGWFYVLVTGALVYWLARIMCASLEAEIRERRRAQADLDDALVEAERANQAKSQFLATMSHEFRTPLNAILGFSEILRAQTFGPLGAPKYMEYADDIHQSGVHMLTLVSDVLDVSEIESGRLTLIPSTFDIRELVEDCVKNFRVGAAARNIAVAIEIDGRTMHADRLRVSQIVTNLLSNAIKFTDGGGRVTVAARPEAGALALRVIDDGVGIPPEMIARVTEPFTQAHRNPHLTQGGSGLGLAIVKALAEAHGGGLTIDSAPGRGTTVTVRFPDRAGGEDEDAAT